MVTTRLKDGYYIQESSHHTGGKMDLIEKYLTEGKGFVLNVGGNMVPIGNYQFEYVMTDGGDPQYVINSAKTRKIPFKVVKQTKNSVIISADARLHSSLWQSFGSLNEPITVNKK